MDPSTILFAIAGLAALSFIAGRQRAILVAARGSVKRLNSLPGYYGAYLSLWCALPLLVLLLVWIFIEPAYIRSEVLRSLPAEVASMPADQLGLVYNDIRNFVDGNIVSAQPNEALAAAADVYRATEARSRQILVTMLVVLGLIAFVFAWRRIGPKFRARNGVEKTVDRVLAAGDTRDFESVLRHVLREMAR